MSVGQEMETAQPRARLGRGQRPPAGQGCLGGAGAGEGGWGLRGRTTAAEGWKRGAGGQMWLLAGVGSDHGSHHTLPA